MRMPPASQHDDLRICHDHLSRTRGRTLRLVLRRVAPDASPFNLQHGASEREPKGKCVFGQNAMKQRAFPCDDGVALRAGEKEVGMGMRRMRAHHESVSIANFCNELLAHQKGKSTIDRKHANGATKRPLHRGPYFVSA